MLQLDCDAMNLRHGSAASSRAKGEVSTVPLRRRKLMGTVVEVTEVCGVY